MGAQAGAFGGKNALTPGRVIAAGFAALIVIGTVLLALPVSSATGQSVGVFDALFTAVSASCVTGLVTLDTGTAFSRFGQTVLLLLIQTGGLGFMLLATIAMRAMGMRITLKARVVMRESMNASELRGAPYTLMRIGATALCIEAAGALLLCVRTIPRYGVLEGLYRAVFHSVSAFCNAGFDLMGGFSSLTSYRNDAYVLTVIMLLITTGGLGFFVLGDIARSKGVFKRFSLHTKLALIVSGTLLLSGTLLIAVSEAAGGHASGSWLLDALFQSVTARTAGFNSVDQTALTGGSLMTTIVLMFIGASPASTGGGVKTTTMGVAALVALSVIRGREDVSAMGRRLPAGLVRTAVAIVLISLLLWLLGCVALCALEPEQPMEAMLYELTSAMGTVGISAAGTPSLGRPAQALLMVYMYLGRVGPLTMMMVFVRRASRAEGLLHYPEERVLIG